MQTNVVDNGGKFSKETSRFREIAVFIVVRFYARHALTFLSSFLSHAVINMYFTVCK